jgi:hypothetical protein
MMAERSSADERLRRAIEADTVAAIEGDRVRYERSGNPLIAWMALNSWFLLNQSRAEGNEECTPLPEWLGKYLQIIATRLADLAKRLDYRETPEPYGTLPRTAASFQQADNRKPKFTPNEAKQKVPAALGLVRPGWNAFERLAALRSLEVDELTREVYRDPEIVEKTLTAEQADEWILEDYEKRSGKVPGRLNVTDPRSVRRRRTKLKGERQKPRG